MASIADLEQLLEQLFERSATRLFRTRVQAVQLEHRVERAMERSRTGRGSRTEVPSRYRVRVNPDDLDDLAPDADAAQLLAARLADATLAFARAHAYHLARRPIVAVVADPSLERGRVEADVDARPTRHGQRFSAPVPGIAPAGPPANDVASSSAALSRDARRLPGPSMREEDAGRDAGAASVPDALSQQPPTGLGIRGDGSQTHVFRRPSPESASAVLRMLGTDGREVSLEVDGRPLTVGRARDNRLVIEDPRVSRHHGRLLARHGVLVYADLNSTNGSRVNGVRVDEVALGVGDRILLGDTVLVVESLPG
jgi:hypothetical protein